MIDDSASPLEQSLPAGLAARLTSTVPCRVSIAGNDVELSSVGGSRSLGQRDGLLVDVRYDEPSENVITWTIRLINISDVRVEDIAVVPLHLSMDLDPAVQLPRIRHLSGSWHYDACYPPRSFRVSEEAFMTHDHAKRVDIGGANAGPHVPILQFAVGDTALEGFFVGFEWSAGWRISAGWAAPSHHGESRPPFTLIGSMDTAVTALAPGESVELPPVHLGSFSGQSWQDLEDFQRQYFTNVLSPPPVFNTRHPVSYDHWFGLYEGFDIDLLKRQASRAAELGVEAFCLDACWYTSTGVFSGLGNWNQPDLGRFPNGSADVRALGEFVRSLGMRFGLWHIIQLADPTSWAAQSRPELFRPSAHPESYARNMTDFGWIAQRHDPQSDAFTGLQLALELPEAVEFALSILRTWILDWGVEWFRFESIPEDGLAYNYGFNRLIDLLRAEFPQVYIEICNGGGQRLDLSSIRRTHGNWLSDHTTSAAVTRFNQTGALRFWPSHMLNMAVVAMPDTSDLYASDYEVLSRMAGVLSFNGDIAQWSDAAVQRVRALVDVYKQIRPLLSGTAHFPLRQPTSIDDWDVVVFEGNVNSRRLIFAYRMSGTSSASFCLPPTSVDQLVHNVGWEQLAGPASARLASKDARLEIELPPYSAAIWREA